MHEPRGHADMYGVIPVEPDHPDADLAVLFCHNEGYSTMCGHATIAMARWAVDEGLVAARAPRTKVRIQCPCGLVTAHVQMRDGRAGMVHFESVGAFAPLLDAKVEVEGLGAVEVDIGYGGAFYAFAPASRFGLDVRTSPARTLVDAAWAVTCAAKAQLELDHPGHPDLAFLYGTILTDGTNGRRPSQRERLRLRGPAGGPQPDGERRHGPDGDPEGAGARRGGGRAAFLERDGVGLLGVHRGGDARGGP